MEIIAFIVFVLICIGLYNAKDVRSVEMVIEVNDFSTSYFTFGVYFQHIHEHALGYVEELTIGLVFININLIYYKDVRA